MSENSYYIVPPSKPKRTFFEGIMGGTLFTSTMSLCFLSLFYPPLAMVGLIVALTTTVYGFYEAYKSGKIQKYDDYVSNHPHINIKQHSHIQRQKNNVLDQVTKTVARELEAENVIAFNKSIWFSNGTLKADEFEEILREALIKTAAKHNIELHTLTREQKVSLASHLTTTIKNLAETTTKDLDTTSGYITSISHSETSALNNISKSELIRAAYKGLNCFFVETVSKNLKPTEEKLEIIRPEKTPNYFTTKEEKRLDNNKTQWINKSF